MRVNQNYGYVYILSNECMPGLVKIGRSIHGGFKRSNSINQTGVPAPFKLEFELYTPDCKYLEYSIHDELGHLRVSDNREFFRISVEEATERLLNMYLSAFAKEIATQDFYVPEDIVAGYEQRLTTMGFNPFGPQVADSLQHIVNDDLKRIFEGYLKIYEARIAAYKKGSGANEISH